MITLETFVAICHNWLDVYEAFILLKYFVCFSFQLHSRANQNSTWPSSERNISVHLLVLWTWGQNKSLQDGQWCSDSIANLLVLRCVGSPYFYLESTCFRKSTSIWVFNLGPFLKGPRLKTQMLKNKIIICLQIYKYIKDIEKYLICRIISCLLKQ